MNKTIFITGTSSGFGKATVELFAQNGWNVAATVKKTYIDSDLFSHLPNVSVYELDITNFEQVNLVATAVIQQFGTIDVVVNNAGYCLMGPIETCTMEQIKEQYETNVFGSFAVTKAFIQHFRENNEGLFINISSSTALYNYPYIGLYGSTKSAIRGFSEALRIELAPYNIQVKTIYPGAHATKIFTKTVDGTGTDKTVFKAYKPYFKNLFLSQSSLIEATAPSNIAHTIWNAVHNKKGKTELVSGGDAKFFWFLKKILSEKMFQSMQIKGILKRSSKFEIFVLQKLMGKNTQKLEIVIDEELIN